MSTLGTIEIQMLANLARLQRHHGRETADRAMVMAASAVAPVRDGDGQSLRCVGAVIDGAQRNAEGTGRRRSAGNRRRGSRR